MTVGLELRLTARGVIVLHISNRHMALWRPAAAVGDAEGLVAYGKGEPRPDTTDDEWRTAAEVVVFARDVRDLGDLPAQPGWNDSDSRVAPGPMIMPTFLGARPQAPALIRRLSPAVRAYCNKEHLRFVAQRRCLLSPRDSCSRARSTARRATSSRCRSAASTIGWRTA